MRALVFEGPGRLALREVPRPEPGAGEVLVRVGHPIGHECCVAVAAIGAGSLVPSELNAIHYQQLHVSGASESRRRDFAEAIALVSNGRLDLSRLITHRLPLEKYQEAFKLAADGSAIKVAFDMIANFGMRIAN